MLRRPSWPGVRLLKPRMMSLQRGPVTPFVETKPALSDTGGFGIRIVARVGAIGVVEQMVGRRAFKTDRQLAVGLALHPPVALAKVNDAVLVELNGRSWSHLLDRWPAMPSSMV